ncbi:hypothetical protein NITGR_130038 [Nitrospina gracilis 3/211]|uniref:Uncharacterized protein n=1 Tax=Nitrospina gracilis (strain 3/211) TaxID=1266370 RepID=M1YVE2_NITG3|nr:MULTISPECIES: hypothetical protein [Nitrospina]MCF8722640.1 hypothetical protein [Nitrospina sp. Nb-3]CCQ89572.1 hypothetical protein NITGR_130038 [Nitrospina gracilis 3/211]
MSHYILLNGWMGADQDEATDKMARVFRLSNEEAGPIVDLLANGNPWQFEYQVSDQQTEVAKNFLTDLGFEVETIPAIVKGGAPEPMPQEMAAPAKKAKGGMLGGLMAKLSGLFSRKKKKAEPEMEAAAMDHSMDMDAEMNQDMEAGMDEDFGFEEQPKRDD